MPLGFQKGVPSSFHSIPLRWSLIASSAQMPPAARQQYFAVSDPPYPLLPLNPVPAARYGTNFPRSSAILVEEIQCRTETRLGETCTPQHATCRQKNCQARNRFAAHG